MKALHTRLWITTGILLLSIFHSAAGTAKKIEHQYAILIGNNAPPAEQQKNLRPLRYADDDVIRVYHFMSRIVSKAWLLTVADQTTQRRYPDISGKTEIPTKENLNRAVKSLSALLARDAAAGIKSTVFLYFSGHGTHDAMGVPGLVLQDGQQLTREILYRKIIDRLDADFIHLFIDACYAEGVVGSRGLFENEANATRVSLTNEEQRAIASVDTNRYPSIGIFVSSSASRQSHEWSKLESGVFTHVVLSGLSGLADINGDGKIAYSELYAFAAAASRSVKKELARVEVVARPPARNQNEPIVDMSNISHAAFLTGNMSRLGHFHVELENGERFIDGHLSGIETSRFWVPANQQIFLYSENREAAVTIPENQQFNIDNLTLSRAEVSAKGPMEIALARGLFLSTYTPQYYQGIIDSSALISVPFGSPPVSTLFVSQGEDLMDTPLVRKRKTWSTLLFSLAAVASGMAGTFAILSLRAKDDYYNTTDTQTEKERNNDYQHYGTAFWITGALVPIAITAGVLIWSRHSRLSTSSVALGTDLTTGMRLNFSMDF
jgi:hypothetical protein